MVTSIISFVFIITYRYMVVFFLDSMYNKLIYLAKIPLTFVIMSLELNQSTCIEVASSGIDKREALKQVKKAVDAADRQILRAIGCILHRWPEQAKVSLEEWELSLEILVKVKAFSLNLYQEWSSAQDTIWNVVNVIRSFLPVMKEKEELDDWTRLRNYAERVYEVWRLANSRVEELTKAATDSEEKWRATMVVNTPVTGASLNSTADAPPNKLLAKGRPKRVEPDVKIHVTTYLYLGKLNSPDWACLRYTQAEIDALKAVERVIRLALFIGASYGFYKGKTEIVDDYNLVNYFWLCPAVHFSTSLWTNMRAWLLDLETQLAPSFNAQIE
jgi:hypothetical protein